MVQGIRWHIQMEKLRLQQWKVLNHRAQASLDKQEKMVGCYKLPVNVTNCLRCPNPLKISSKLFEEGPILLLKCRLSVL